MQWHRLTHSVAGEIIGEQIKVNKCRTKSGKKLYIALLYYCKIHSLKTIYLYINIYAIKLKYINFKHTAQ